MNLRLTICVILACLIFGGCYKRPGGPSNPWEKVDFSAETPIRTVHASPLEVLAITDNEFYRIDENNEVIEKRRLLLPNRFFGRPAISDFSFIRLVRTVTESQVAEIHLVRNPDRIFEFKINDVEVPEGQTIEVEGGQRNPGAYNLDGSQFLLPVRVQPDFYYAFLLLDIKLNATRTDFEEVRVNKRIDVPNLPADPDNIQNIKFINGFYYITTLNGAFRISPEGDYTTLFTTWMIDSFLKNNQVHITSANDFDFYASSDNGISWERVGFATPIKFVERANNLFFSQKALGFPFDLIEEDQKTLSPIVLNRDFPDDFAAFSNIVYFSGNYYLSVQKELYYVEEIEVEE